MSETSRTKKKKKKKKFLKHHSFLRYYVFRFFAVNTPMADFDVTEGVFSGVKICQNRPKWWKNWAKWWTIWAKTLEKKPLFMSPHQPWKIENVKVQTVNTQTITKTKNSPISVKCHRNAVACSALWRSFGITTPRWGWYHQGVWPFDEPKLKKHALPLSLLYKNVFKP